ncbi:Unknown protein sequence [Pseudomonas savastanoi pv. phaseolicola]|nr:Unknown protein sequence [Pseudomonas savastanoi pv. phaseolicola]KPB59485.1 Unknown protein sequence [Pseudomonas amygdali pv. mellea]
MQVWIRALISQVPAPPSLRVGTAVDVFNTTEHKPIVGHCGQRDVQQLWEPLSLFWHACLKPGNVCMPA